jgi:hypothetical protein
LCHVLQYLVYVPEMVIAHICQRKKKRKEREMLSPIIFQASSFMESRLLFS